jgi:SPOR domain
MSYQFGPAEFDRREELLGDLRETDEPPPQRILTVAATLAVMAVFAAGLWFAFYEGTRHTGGGSVDNVPLIRADARPMMVKPAEPGGLRIPDRNMLIYDPGKPMVEHLLPQPEQPMARPTPADAHGKTEASPAASALETANSPATSALVRASAPAMQPPATAPGAPSLKAGRVRLQLGSVRSVSAARLEWDRIQHRNSDLLGALSATPARADLGDKGAYYRIETGPVGDPAATRICNELKQRKFGCIIVR